MHTFGCQTKVDNLSVVLSAWRGCVSSCRVGLERGRQGGREGCLSSPRAAGLDFLDGVRHLINIEPVIHAKARRPLGKSEGVLSKHRKTGRCRRALLPFFIVRLGCHLKTSPLFLSRVPCLFPLRLRVMKMFSALGRRGMVCL